MDYDEEEYNDYCNEISSFIDNYPTKDVLELHKDLMLKLPEIVKKYVKDEPVMVDDNDDALMAFLTSRPSWIVQTKEDKELITRLATFIRKRAINVSRSLIYNKFPNFDTKIPFLGEYFQVYTFDYKTRVKINYDENSGEILKNKLIELINKQKFDDNKGCQSVCFKTVLKRLGLSYKQLRNDIKDFDKVFYTEGVSSSRIIRLRRY
jgi:hypothetical protein